MGKTNKIKRFVHISRLKFILKWHQITADDKNENPRQFDGPNYPPT